MNVITKPNFTQVPNVVLDYWIHHLKNSEFKVLLILCRQTFGWHRNQVELSIKKIMNLANINSRPMITNALKSLEEKKLIIKKSFENEDGSRAPNVYEINVYDPDEDDSKKDLGGGSNSALRSSNSEPPSSNSEPGVVLIANQGGGFPPIYSIKERSKEKKKIQKEKRVADATNGADAPCVCASSFSSNSDEETQSVDERLNENAPNSHSKARCEQNTPQDKETYGEGAFVRLRALEYEKLIKEHGQEKINEIIQDLDDYIGSTGKRYKSHYHTIKMWLKRNAEKQNARNSAKKDSLFHACDKGKAPTKWKPKYLNHEGAL